MADVADMADGIPEYEVSRGIKRIRDEMQRSNVRPVVTECLNCSEPSTVVFCSSECRDDYEHRKARSSMNFGKVRV